MKATALFRSALGLLALASATPDAARAQAPALAVIGDSMSDEYRADDNRGGNYAATTLNWVELLQRYRGVAMGSWGTRAEPRRTGYEFNWARSGAAHSSLQAQANGLAPVLRAGRVEYVVQLMGANDFNIANGSYEACYNGASSCGQGKINAIVAQSTASLDTVLAAGARVVVVVTIPDLGGTPRIIARFPDATRRQRVTAAVNACNAGIRVAAASRGVLVMDISSVSGAILARAGADGVVRIAGEVIDMARGNNEPHALILSDNHHLGTVANAFIANQLLEQLNQRGFAVQPFTDAEVVTYAGIKVSGGGTPAPAAPTNLRIVSGLRAGGGWNGLRGNEGNVLQGAQADPRRRPRAVAGVRRAIR